MPIIVWCICPDLETGQALATQIVKKSLAACVNILPAVTSIFRWENQIETHHECLLMIKTIAKNFDLLTQFIQQQHPYATPEIMSTAIDQGSANYLTWIAENCVA